ncbi:MAG: hypothetical protein H6740_12230 [Alphaproteobacteria bacterium]|nr:hypothetical protein [Alphaproteobacteria bacterium]
MSPTPLAAELQAFDLSDDEDILVYAGTAYEWDEEAGELLEPYVLRRQRLSTGETWDLELLRLPEGSEPRAPWIRVSPCGRWAVVLTETVLHLYREGERVWDRPLKEQVDPHAGLPWRSFIHFTADGRWLLLRPAQELEIGALDLESLELRHRFAVQADPVAPPSLAVLGEGELLLRQRFHFTRLSLPELRPLGEPVRRVLDRYPSLDMVGLEGGVLVSFAPMSDPWYDREDQGTLFGTFAARRQKGKCWEDLGVHELYGELYLDGPEAWDLRAAGARAVGVYPHPKEWTRLVAVGLPDGVSWDLDLERRAQAFRVSPKADAVWVASGQGLERHPLAWPASAEAARRAERRRRLEALSEGRGGWWAWGKILHELESIELKEDLRAAVAFLAPRLAGWQASARVPPESWAPEDPRLALTPLRRVARVGGIGEYALAPVGEAQLIVETSVRDARVRLREGGQTRTLAEAKASGKGVILTPGPITLSEDGRTWAVALHHADPIRYCESSQVSPIGGGQQLLLFRDGALVGHLKDDFKKVDEATDDRRHAAFALSPDGEWLYSWMLGGGALSRIRLPDMHFERSVPWPRALDLALSPDGRLLAVADYPETRILDARTLETLLRVHVDGQPCPSARVCFDAAGRHLAMVQAGPERGSLRRSLPVLTLRLHRLEDGGRASVEWSRAPWPMPRTLWDCDEDDPPRVTLELARHGEELRLLVGEERGGVAELIELSTLRRARLECDYQGFLTLEPGGGGVLLGLEQEVLRWSPTLG